jgi:hypothetical protein
MHAENAGLNYSQSFFAEADMVQLLQAYYTIPAIVCYLQ